MEDKFLKVAKQAALEAGKVVTKYAGRSQTLNLKYDDKSDFVTNADLASERIIKQILSNNFPTHNIIAEEETRINKNSKYTWIIDPLDGTISFSATLPFFSVSIGLLENQKPILGVIFDAFSKNLYTARFGRGTDLNGKPVRVSKQKDLEAALVDVDTGHRARRQQKIDSYISRMLMQVGYLYSFGPAAGILGQLAKGNLDAYIAQGWSWDFVAGAVIVREAGGTVTDFQGKEPDWTQDRLSIVASNGLIHDQILKALR